VLAAGPSRITICAPYASHAAALPAPSAVNTKGRALMSPAKHLKHPLLVAALALGGLALAPAPAAASDSGTRSVIISHGSGEVRVQPDSVHIDLGAEAQAASLDEATSQVSTAMQRVLDAVHRLELSGLTLETRTVRLTPVYAPPKDGHPQSIVGYSAANHVIVTEKSAPEDQLAAYASQIIDAAVGAGANSVGDPEFFLADPSQVEDEALTLAVQNAESDAHTIAKAASVTIVGLMAIEEASASRAPRSLVMSMQAMSVAAPMLASTPIEIGDITIESDVTAKYEFQ
jgi:uncharacterized protein